MTLTPASHVADTKELFVDMSRYESALLAFLAGSKKSLVEVVLTRMKGVIRAVLTITPPAHFHKASGNEVVGIAAKRAGYATVQRDISSMYGTPRQAYDKIAAVDPKQAKAFWKHKMAGDQPQANVISRKTIGRSFAPFDGGTIHRRLTANRRPRPAKSIVYYVSDTDTLKAYTKTEQSHVFWLAAGWTEAARAFGVTVPQNIARLPAPGTALIQITEEAVRVTATNAVTYARGVQDMERRVQWAVNDQAGAMERIVKNNLLQSAKRAGFSIVGNPF